jgi:hypothetical protein
LIERLATTFSDHTTEPEEAQFIASVIAIAFVSLTFVNYWFQSARQIASQTTSSTVFQSVELSFGHLELLMQLEP